MYPNFCSISRCHFEAGSERDDEYRRWPNSQFAIGNPKLPHWITSSARTGTDCGTVRLRALAVVRLIARWTTLAARPARRPVWLLSRSCPRSRRHADASRKRSDHTKLAQPPLQTVCSVTLRGVARSAESYRPRFRLAGCASAWYRPTNKNRGEEGARALGWVPRPCCATRVPVATREGSG